MPVFNILPDMETFFLPEYRSPQFLGAGLNLVFSLHKNVDLRLDAYYYQPFVILQKNGNGTIEYTRPTGNELLIASSTFIYHSPIGPVRATANYFPKQLNPLSFQISFGYVLFNERAVR